MESSTKFFRKSRTSGRQTVWFEILPLDDASDHKLLNILSKFYLLIHMRKKVRVFDKVVRNVKDIRKIKNKWFEYLPRGGTSDHVYASSIL